METPEHRSPGFHQVFERFEQLKSTAPLEAAAADDLTGRAPGHGAAMTFRGPLRRAVGTGGVRGDIEPHERLERGCPETRMRMAPRVRPSA